VGVAVLLYVDRRFKLRAPSLFALYVVWYTFGRFFEELLRIDPSHHIAGLRLNAWVSIVLFVLSTAFFIWWQFFRSGDIGTREPRRPLPKGPAMAIPRGKR
jgi:prolipoprotein diacylglyceryltransferase